MVTYHVYPEMQNRLNILARNKTGLRFYSGLISILREGKGSFRIIRYGRNGQAEEEFLISPSGFYFLVGQEKKDVRFEKGEFTDADPRLLKLLDDFEISLLGPETPGSSIFLEPAWP